MAAGGQTWLILGDRGFIGSAVRWAVEATGAQVVGASRSPQADIACDLADPGSIEAAVARVRPTHVVNTAGPPSVARSWDHPAETAQLHAVASLNLLSAIKRHIPGAHLTLLSSAEVYGSSQQVLNEEAPLRPLTPYGAAKAAMEVLCDQFAHAHGMELATLRLFNQIGPSLAPGHAIADFAATVARAEAEVEAGKRDAAAGVSVRVGNPDAIRDYTDVRDCAAAILRIAAERATGTFNLCSGRATSTRDLVAALDQAATIPVSLEVDPALSRPIDPARKVGDPTRLTAAAGWVATTPLSQTITDILTTARA